MDVFDFVTRNIPLLAGLIVIWSAQQEKTAAMAMREPGRWYSLRTIQLIAAGWSAFYFLTIVFSGDNWLPATSRLVASGMMLGLYFLVRYIRHSEGR